MSDETESDIVNFYKDKTVFITGATGFLGKIVLEKLLRTCYSIRRVFLLVREKKGIGRKERFDEIFSAEIWKPLLETNPSFKDKVFLVEGDLVKPNLGLSDDSIELLTNEINIVFHCAATVRFDQHIRTATYINTRAVRDLMEISKQMRNLEVFVHVSTAYSNCPRISIDEKIYDPPMKADDLLKLVEMFDDNKLADLTKNLLGEWPNTYTYTKSVTEAMIADGSGKIPMVICRPAVITGAVSEPLPGWIDNYYGPASLLIGVGLGIMRCMMGKMDNKISMVPSDYITNWMIAASYDVALRKRSQNMTGSASTSVPIYNYCAHQDNTPTWRIMHNISKDLMQQYASVKCVWIPIYWSTTCVYRHRIQTFLLQTIPAHIIDLVLRMRGQEPKAVKIYEKVDQFTEVVSYFGMREWEFGIDNTRKLWTRLNSQDQHLFPFSMENFNWENYFHIFVKGLRIFLVKDPMETVSEGRKKHFKLKILHYTLCTFLIILGFFILRCMLSFVLKIVIKLSN